MDALAEVVPGVAARLPRLILGSWPTPVERLALPGEVWVKREDLSSPLYGGNKVRCLEPVLGALARQAAGRRWWATGAWGSNQAVAHAVHATRMGFTCGALLFPQPVGAAAAANLGSLASLPVALRLLRTMPTFPLEYMRLRMKGEVVIPPGAAVPEGALGHLAAALEVALAVREGLLPAPRHVVLPVGSTCTTAGLLVGFALAVKLGLGLDRVPQIHAVRVTPWPVTARGRILRLARRAAIHLAQLGGPPLDPTRHGEALQVTGAWLGAGYGHPTPAGEAARHRFAEVGAPHLDLTYSAKAAACLLSRLPGGEPRRERPELPFDGPVLFWSTKSHVQPPTTAEGLARLPARCLRWYQRGQGLSAESPGIPGESAPE